jgi:hypothetical protein
MMESLGELTDMELGRQIGSCGCMRLNTCFRQRFEAYVNYTGIRSRDAMSPFWKGWLIGFTSYRRHRKVDIEFLKRIKWYDVHGFETFDPVGFLKR